MRRVGIYAALMEQVTSCVLSAFPSCVAFAHISVESAEFSLLSPACDSAGRVCIPAFTLLSEGCT